MFCKNCGVKIKKDIKFCGKCGHLISSNKNEAGSIEKEEFLNSSEELKQVKETANIEMIKGVGWVVLGLFITFITYQMASEGGSYFVFWGLAVYGGYIFFRGLYWRISPKSLLGKVHKIIANDNEEH